MKKTVTTTIGNLQYELEQNAYLSLSNYIQSFEDHFKNASNVKLVTDSIELDISKWFTQLQSEKLAIINLETVDFVKMKIGSPVDFDLVEENTITEVNSTANFENNKTAIEENVRPNRKLMRDKEGGIFSGVCAGFAHFFGVNPNIIRLVIFLLVWFGVKYVITIYILFWAAIPKAKTPEDKFLMKEGEPFSFNKTAGKISGEDETTFNKFINQLTELIRQLIPTLVNFSKIFAKGIATSYGVFLLSILGIIFLSFVIGLSVFNEYVESFAQIVGFNLNSVRKILLFVLGIPFILLIFSVIHLVFSRNYFRAYIVIPMLGIWACSIYLLYNEGSEIYKSFENEGSINEVQILNDLEKDTLYIDVLEAKHNLISAKKNNSSVSKKLHLLMEDSLHFKELTFVVKKSINDSLQLKIEKKALGESTEKGSLRASKISYYWKTENNRLLLNPYLSILKKDAWRWQQVVLTLEVPERSYIHLSTKMNAILPDTNSTTSLTNKNMLNKILQMTDDGLILTK